MRYIYRTAVPYAYAYRPYTLRFLILDQGFRSSFGFNTNIWLSKRFERLPASTLVPAGGQPRSDGGSTGEGKAPKEPKGVLRVAGQASLFTQDQDMKVRQQCQ